MKNKLKPINYIIIYYTKYCILTTLATTNIKTNDETFCPCNSYKTKNIYKNINTPEIKPEENNIFTLKAITLHITSYKQLPYIYAYDENILT